MPTNRLNNTGGKSTVRLKKSTRKPLRDVSNSVGGVKTLANSIKTKKLLEDQRENDQAQHITVIDRLLLIRSDLSSVIDEIDELVQALRTGGKKSGNKIESFEHILSEMQDCLKPWVSKVQKAASNLSTRSENPFEKSQTSELLPAVADSPQPSKRDSQVSPSPLVSWRAAGCTPLPQPKLLSSRYEGSSKILASNTHAQLHPLFDDTSDAIDSPEQSIHMLVSPSPLVLCHAGSTRLPHPTVLLSECQGPSETSSTHSQLLMTPCFKISPPKSCVLLEPLSEHKCRDRHGAYRMTPYPTSLLSSSTSESNSSEGGGKVGNETPNWLVSPPKTCVMKEPPEETGSDIKGTIESTPLMAKSRSVVKTGKQPGENTLKKELWLKFEAASTDGIRFNPSIFRKTTQNAFLERLDEVSCNEETEEGA